MAEVNYKATTSSDNQNDEPSVEILDPKVNSFSVSFSNTLEETEDPDKDLDIDHPNRPSTALWKQQKLPAWQPILTSDTVLPAFFLLGVALVPIGVGLLISSNNVKEWTYDYTDCFPSGGKKSCSDILSDSLALNKSVKCMCEHEFTLDTDYIAPVFFYYGLSSFYQNHRRYVKSRLDSQLSGKTITKDTKDLKDCEPFDKVGDQVIAPCGAIANSFFNDTFKLYIKSGNTIEKVDLAQTDIAWPTDKEVKYKNPSDTHNYAKPLFWQKTVFDLDFNHPDNNGYKNEHLIVWMRTAALPTFRKLWARIDHDQNIQWRTRLPKGNYVIQIDYNYLVKKGKWSGGKHIFISNTSWLGGKNSFLGYAYIVVGAICLILWLVFLIIVKKFGQKPKDIVDIGPKTLYTFTASKPIDYGSGDGSKQPLRSTP